MKITVWNNGKSRTYSAEQIDITLEAAESYGEQGAMFMVQEVPGDALRIQGEIPLRAELQKPEGEFKTYDVLISEDFNA